MSDRLLDQVAVVKDKRNPILSCGAGGIIFLTWDSLWVYHPCVLRKGDAYYMIYTGRRDIRIKHQIGLAISSNLITWRKDSINPIIHEGSVGEWDAGLVAHGDVIKVKDKYYMFYDGSPKKLWREEIGLATSKDLKTWTKHPGNPILTTGNEKWESVHVSRCSVLKEGNTYYLFYAGHDGVSERVGLATSQDLYNWTKHPNCPLLDLGPRGAWDEKSVSDPKVLKIDDVYFMLYSGYDSKGVGRIGLAISEDLVHWTKYRGNPILGVGRRGWDHVEACRADFKTFDGKRYIFYSGYNGTHFRIGLAYLKL